MSITALIVAAIAVPFSAEAQDRIGITLGAGVVGGADAPPATDFARPMYAVSIQRVMKRHFVLDGELAHWRHTLRFERGPHDVFGPEGRLGRVSGTTIISSHKLWNLSINLLVRSTGRVRVFGGGGAGVSTDDSEHSQQSFDCSPSLDPRTCNRFVTARVRGPLPLFRALGGVEVPVTARLGIIGAVRAEASAWEDRSNWVSAIAGVRFSFN